MERNLRELTLDRMLEIGNVQFYEREVDYDKMMKWYEDMSLDIALEVVLKREQELSNEIYNLTIDILSASGNEIKPLKGIQYLNYAGVSIYFEDDSRVFIDNDVVLKGVYKYFKGYGYNKKDLTINTFKSSLYWEVGLGTDFDYGDIRIHCSQFLLQSVIQVIENNLMSDDF